VAFVSTHRRICTLCEAACGLAVTLENDTVTAVRGDPTDPHSHGYLCSKARRIADRDVGRFVRVQTPLLRRGGGWVEASWSDAMAEVAHRIVALQAEHGPDSVAICFGNPVAYDYATVFFGRLLLLTLRTANRYSTTSLDGLPHLVASRLMFGNQMLLPVPDLDRTDLFVIIGANPLVSNGSVMSAPGMAKRLRDLQRRGGRVVVIDPRRTETARHADQHIFIRPGTDAAVLLAVLHILLRDHPPAPSQLLRGDTLTMLADLSREWDEERAAAMTGVPAQIIAELAIALATARTSVCYGRIGVAHQPFGTLTCWLINVLNIVTGNFDRPGGAMFTRPAVDLVTLARLTGDRGDFGEPTRVRQLPTFSGERPIAALADEIAVRGPGSIRALVTIGANLALSAPNGGRVERMLDQLDLLVCIDPYLNETTRHAHAVLPPCTSLQRDQYGLITSLVAVRNIAKYVPRAVETTPEVREEWQILSALHRELAARGRRRPRTAHRALAAAAARLGPRRMLDLALLVGPYGIRCLPSRPLSATTLATRYPEGRDFGALTPMLRRRRVKVRVVPDEMTRELRRLTDSIRHDLCSNPEGTLLLIGRRRRRSINSWLPDDRGQSPDQDACILMISPDDARKRGIQNGAQVLVRSKVGSLVVTTDVTCDIMPGVVSLPHGCRTGAGLGTSVNDLTDELRIDELSGTAAFSGVAVMVSAQ
jgi:anaerobic selenocysteine-containing dehydrogenase